MIRKSKPTDEMKKKNNIPSHSNDTQRVNVHLRRLFLEILIGIHASDKSQHMAGTATTMAFIQQFYFFWRGMYFQLHSPSWKVFLDHFRSLYQIYMFEYSMMS